jgi:hypothetical protein
MLRGEFSNRPAAICGIDYRVLIEERQEYSWFIKKVPELLLHKSFETVMKRALPVKKGAKGWLETNTENRIVVFSVGVPLLERALDMVIGDYVAETYHFYDKAEFRFWLRQTPHVYKVYTNDFGLIGLEGITVRHSGWSERI